MIDKPLSSLHKTQKLLRSSERRGKEPIEIIILGEGIHYLGKPLILESADSSTKDAPVTFRADDGKTAVIRGGANLGNLEPHSDIRFVENIFEELDAPPKVVPQLRDQHPLLLPIQGPLPNRATGEPRRIPRKRRVDGEIH